MPKFETDPATGKTGFVQDAEERPIKEVASTIDLSDRKSDGMTVILWWVKDTLETYVTVDDQREGVFSVHPVPEGTNPNDVFYHPHGYPEAKDMPAVQLGEN